MKKTIILFPINPTIEMQHIQKHYIWMFHYNTHRAVATDFKVPVLRIIWKFITLIIPWFDLTNDSGSKTSFIKWKKAADTSSINHYLIYLPNSSHCARQPFIRRATEALPRVTFPSRLLRLLKYFKISWFYKLYASNALTQCLRFLWFQLFVSTKDLITWNDDVHLFTL